MKGTAKAYTLKKITLLSVVCLGDEIETNQWE